MQVVVSSSRVVFHHCIISFVIVCFGFVVVPEVSLNVFSYGPLVRFCTSFPFLLFVILFVLALCHRPVTSG